MKTILAYLADMGAYMALALPMWAVFRAAWLAGRRKKPRWGREVLLALFVAYLAGLASQTLTVFGGRIETASWAGAMERWQYGWGINLVPGRTIRSYWFYGNRNMQLVNLAGNVAVFLPMGFLPPLIWKKLNRWLSITVLCAGASLFIECAQLFLNRSVDVDDLILNTLGGLLGYLAFRLIFRRPKKEEETDDPDHEA